MSEMSDDYAIAEPIGAHAITEEEPQTRYFAVIRHKPAGNGDPIPWLATIYRGEAVEAFWRGDEDEAQDALGEYLAQRVTSDD